jgi:type I restriction enzyme S subunit
MEYPTYQKVKKVDIRWLETLPAHWQVNRLKHIAHINSQVLSEATYEGATIQYVDIGSVALQGLQNPPEELRFGDAPSRARRVVCAGDTIVSTVRTYLQAIAYFENPPNNLIASTGFAVLTPTKQVFPKFLYYLVRAPRFINDVTAHSVGVGYPAINPSELANLPVWLPNLQEQQAIANFLDRESAVIDALIAKKRELIERLQEKRTALISHAVTKGLDPTVPMKDSGVEWLGEIPAHWDVVRFKFVTPSFTVGIVITPSKYYVDEGVPCLRSLNVREGYLQDVDLVYISPESNQLLNKSRIYQGDLVSVRTGQPGTTAVVDERFHGANCIDLIITRQSTQFDSFFMAYYLNSLPAKSQFASHSSGAIQQHFNINTAQNLTIPFPTIDEQIAIRNYLDQEDKNLNNLVEKVQDAIERLQEYRTALISAAVTGKIDVRPDVQGDC